MLKETEIFKAAPGFNQKAAKDAYNLVMKMDEDMAREFCFHVVNHVVEETIEKNLRAVQGHLNKVVSKRMERIKKAAITAAARQSDPHAVEFAKAFAEISKAVKNPYDYGYVWQESDFNRDPGSGQFRAKISATNKVKISGRNAQAMGIPPSPSQDRMSPADKARYRQEYLQLSNFLGAVGASGDGDAEVVLHLRNKSGQKYTVRQQGTKPDPKNWDPATERLVGVEAKPTSLNMAGAAFGLSSALGVDAERTRNLQRGINYADKKGIKTFADDWTAENAEPDSSTYGTFNRIAAGSTFLAGVAPAGSKTQMAAAFGSFVGSHGPEAEKVFGPPTRKLAYRYRGTEKEPDSELLRNYSQAVRGATERSNLPDSETSRRIESAITRGINNERKRRADEWNKNNPKRPRDWESFQLDRSERAQIRAAANERYGPKTKGPSPEDLAAGRAVIQDYFTDRGAFRNTERKRKPNSRLYGLQLDSGNTPPSQGVMLDKNGAIVAEAVGYGDDHYLPFNLRNLGKLKDGEYIRTRSVGGLTSEDVYTGLMSGAKRVTVVSRSGTFTIEFDDSFKGGRRYNDKAARMTRRYEQLLDSVRSGQVERADVNPEMRKQITAEVLQELSGPEYNNVARRNEIKRRIDAYKADDEIDFDLIDRRVDQIAAGLPEEQRDRVRRDLATQVQADKEYKFRLNGLGYAAALEALQEQFPYYIKITTRPENEMERSELGVDRGYVEPGRNRPTAARAGLHGTSTNPGRKFSASQADYQGYRSDKRGGTANGSGRLQPTDAKPENEQGSPKVVTAAEKVAEAEKQIKYADTLYETKQVATSLMNPPTDAQGNTQAGYEWWEMDQAAFNDYVSNPSKLSQVEDVIGQINEQNSTNPRMESAYTRLLAAKSGGKGFDRMLAAQFPAQPYVFRDEAAYEKHANPTLRENELNKVGNVHGVLSDIPLKEMNDTQWGEEVAAVARMRRIADSLTPEEMKNVKSDPEMVKRLKGELPSSSTLGALLESHEAMDNYLENIHRTRALMANAPDPGNETQPILRNPNPGEPTQEHTMPRSVEEQRASVKKQLEVARETARKRSKDDSTAQSASYALSNLIKDLDQTDFDSVDEILVWAKDQKAAERIAEANGW